MVDTEQVMVAAVKHIESGGIVFVWQDDSLVIQDKVKVEFLMTRVFIHMGISVALVRAVKEDTKEGGVS